MFKRTKYAVFDIKHHFVWIPKHCKDILAKDLKKRVEEVSGDTAIHGFEIDAMKVMTKL